MKVVGNFNKVSEKLRKELIKPVKQGEVVHFQLLNGVYDPELKREAFGASRSMMLQDTILDPYFKEEVIEGKTEYTSDYVEIGVPIVIKDGRVERCKKFWVEALANGIPGNGQFHLIGGNIDDMLAYEVLCLSNGNKANPYRDKSKEPLYEQVDVEKNIRDQKEKDFKELKAKLARFAKDNPNEAQELSKLIPEKKKQELTT